MGGFFGLFPGSSGGGGGGAGGASDGASVSVDPTEMKVITGETVQEALTETDQALLNARSTGVLYGGGLSSLGSGVVRIAAGGGEILDNSTPENPNYYPVTWVQTDIDLSATDGLKYIFVDTNGQFQVTATEPDHQSYREYLYLWRVSIRSGLVSGFASIVQPSQQFGPQIRDVWEALGYIKRGLVISAASNNLKLAISAGEVYLPGINYYTNPQNPHEIEVNAISPATFRHVDQQGDQTSDRTDLDVANYDLNGTITAIPGASSRAQIFSVYFFPSSGNCRIFYGQTYYSTVADARLALVEGVYSPIIPANYSDAVLLGWVIATKRATNLQDGTQQIITSGRFGTTGGAFASAISKLPIARIDATGTPSALNFLRGDGAWTVLPQWQVQSQASNGSSLTITFDNAGEAFEVFAVIISNSASSLVEIEINGSTGSYTYYQQYNGTPASGAGSYINAGAAGNGSVESILGRLWMNGTTAGFAGDNIVTALGVSQGGAYKTISGLTSLTSFTIKSNQANGIGAGSYIAVRKVK